MCHTDLDWQSWPRVLQNLWSGAQGDLQTFSEWFLQMARQTYSWQENVVWFISVVFSCCVLRGWRKVVCVDHPLYSRCVLAAAERGFAFLTRWNLLCPGFCFPRVCQLFRANYNPEIRLDALWLISKALTEHDKSRLKSLQQEPEAPFQSFVFRTATNRKK